MASARVRRRPQDSVRDRSRPLRPGNQRESCFPVIQRVASLRPMSARGDTTELVEAVLAGRASTAASTRSRRSHAKPTTARTRSASLGTRTTSTPPRERSPTTVETSVSSSRRAATGARPVARRARTSIATTPATSSWQASPAGRECRSRSPPTRWSSRR